MATTTLPGFLIAADAIVPCKECGAPIGKPCKGSTLKPGYIHFGRRVKRLLLTAGDVSKRDAFEARAVQAIIDNIKTRVS